MRRAARRGRNDFAARDAYMRRQRTFELLRQNGERRVNVDGGAECALDIVAVSDGRAENAHHGIADMLVDRAAPARDHGVGELEKARQ